MELSNAQTCLKVEGLIFAIKKKKKEVHVISVDSSKIY